MSRIEKKFRQKVLNEVPDLSEITPGLQVDVHWHGRRILQTEFGKTYDFYDLASLTKVIFTASASILHFSAQPRQLEEPVSQVLPWWRYRSTTPTRLLTHTAGLTWWEPWYKRYKGELVPEKRWPQVERMLAKAKPSRQRKAVYSDLDLWMMGAYLQAARQQSLMEIWAWTAESLELEGLFFHPGNKPCFARKRYAPTEKCPWRGKVLQGEVHDENCWAQGGVGPHAGLFGDLGSVSEWGLKVRAGQRALSSSLFPKSAMVRRFTRRQVPRTVGDWGLCFMKPTKGGASCGRHFHSTSFGHTGFTGTSYWYDPVRDLQVVILSNRVHPTRDNKQFVALRPRLHDWICELL